MNSFELNTGFEIELLPTDEEYYRMKHAYVQGKLDAEVCLGAPVTALQVAEDKYGVGDERIELYLSGWLYQEWLMENDNGISN